MHDALEISSRVDESGVQVFVISGRLDSRSTPRFVRECSPATTPGSTIVLNLAGISFLSSSGVGALLALSEQAREHGGVLRIAAAAPVVIGTIDLLNLREYLGLFDSEAEALRRAA
jgi:anti-sigma B factor antagonist